MPSLRRTHRFAGLHSGFKAACFGVSVVACNLCLVAAQHLGKRLIPHENAQMIS